MPNLSSLSRFTTAAQALSNLILVSPQSTLGYQPQNPPNADGTESTAQLPPAFMFHYEGEQTVSIESDITDHYIEDNTAIQDQISLKPEVIATHGFIGELNDVVPELLKPIKFAADKLTTVGAYVPSLSATALLAYSEAFLLYQVAANAAQAAVSSWDSLTGSGGQNVIGSNGLGGAFNAQTGEVANNQSKQQGAFQQFYGYWRNRTLFTVQTPWAVFQNMAIKSLRAIQDAETNVISDFEISFKMIRFARTETSLTNISSLFQSRGKSQSSSEVDLGSSAPTPSTGLGSGLSTMGVA